MQAELEARAAAAAASHAHARSRGPSAHSPPPAAWSLPGTSWRLPAISVPTVVIPTVSISLPAASADTTIIVATIVVLFIYYVFNERSNASSSRKTLHDAQQSLHAAAVEGDGAAEEIACGNENAQLVGETLRRNGKHSFAELLECTVQSRGDKVKAALVAGADPNERDARGRTSLLVASSMGHADILAMLIEGGGDITQKMESSGASCAWLAAQQGFADCLRVLGEHDPTMLDERNNKGVSPVYIAAQRGHAEAIQVLSDHDANVNARCTRHKFTPVRPEPSQAKPGLTLLALVI